MGGTGAARKIMEPAPTRATYEPAGEGAKLRLGSLECLLTTVPRIDVNDDAPRGLTSGDPKIQTGRPALDPAMYNVRSLLAPLTPFLSLGCLPGRVQSGSPHEHRPSSTPWTATKA